MLEFLDVLEESTYTNITPTSLIKSKLRVDSPTIFLVVPDNNIKIHEEIYNTNFLLSNCEGFITPNKVITIFRKKINGKIHALDIKKNLQILKTAGKKLKITYTLPSIDKKEKDIFYFYDMTVYTQALEYAYTQLDEKLAIKTFFHETTALYNNIKEFLPHVKVDFLFLMKDSNGLLFNLFKNIRTFLPETNIEDINFYDKYGLVNIHNNLIPLFHKEKLKNKINYNAVTRILKLATTIDEVKELNKTENSADNTQPTENNTKEEQLNKPEETKKETTWSKLVADLSNIKKLTSIDQHGEVYTQIDASKIVKILRKYKISDPDIVSNVKAALDAFIREQKIRPTPEEAELVMLKAINYTLHGKTEIDEEYLKNPELLISKLYNIRTHKTPLEIPEDDISLINIKDVVDLNHTTGVWRQKQEFENNIHKNMEKLLSTLETGPHPIKLVKLSHTIEDTDSDRFIRYTAVLKNLTGGFKDPYPIEFIVPAIVNDRYFKIKGGNYIIASQQFMKPITKTDKNEVKILSNYAILHLQLVNTKFNPSDILGVIEYIKLRYPNLIKELTDDYCKFNDKSTIYFTGLKVYDSEFMKVEINEDTGKLMIDDKEIKQGKNEFIYEKLLNLIKTINNEDNLTKTKKSIPYIQLYIGGIRLPLIIYLWQLKGLLTTLNELNIDYNIIDDPQKADIVIPTRNNKYLAIYPNNYKEHLIVNGLLAARIKDTINDLDDPAELYPIIDKNYGAKALYNLRVMTQDFLDPQTKEMLEFENLSTSLPTLLSTTCLDMLLNKKPDSLADLKIYRSRISEINNVVSL